MDKSDFWEIRLNNIKENVSMRSLVDRYNISCQSVGEITQLHCPFHGHDSHASARIYETNTMYCWVCSKIWDVVSFIQDYQNISFIEACSFLEQTYGLDKPDSNIVYQEESFNAFLKKQVSKKEKDFEKDFIKLSNLAIKNRSNFKLKEYINFFSYFDSLYNKYSSGSYEDDSEIINSLNFLSKEISQNI